MESVRRVASVKSWSGNTAIGSERVKIKVKDRTDNQLNLSVLLRIFILLEEKQDTQDHHHQVEVLVGTDINDATSLFICFKKARLYFESRRHKNRNNFWIHFEQSYTKCILGRPTEFNVCMYCTLVRLNVM